MTDGPIEASEEHSRIGSITRIYFKRGYLVASFSSGRSFVFQLKRGIEGYSLELYFEPLGLETKGAVETATYVSDDRRLLVVVYDDNRFVVNDLPSRRIA